MSESLLIVVTYKESRALYEMTLAGLSDQFPPQNSNLAFAGRVLRGGLQAEINRTGGLPLEDVPLEGSWTSTTAHPHCVLVTTS